MLIEVKETQILKVWTITDVVEVFLDKITATLSVILTIFAYFPFKWAKS